MGQGDFIRKGGKMKIRWTMALSIAFLALVLVLLPAGCKKKAEMSESGAAMQEKTAPAPAESAPAESAQQNSMENPYTKDNPGPWAALAEKHIPEITYEKTGTGLKVTVKVDNHPMDPKIPHYIMWIKLQDGMGAQLGEKSFVATDPAPIATFELMSIPEKLKAYEQCNIHGIWLNEVGVNAQ
jgi:superoxide reductase